MKLTDTKPLWYAAALLLAWCGAGAGARAQAPVIAQPPASQTAVAGGSVTFSVVAEGSLPLFCQWTAGGTAIPGATDSTLTLSNLSYFEADTFSVIVSNAAGQVTSAPATLTIVPPPTFANLTNDLVLHLAFDGNATDSSGLHHDGAISGSPAYVPGKLGQAITLLTDTTNGIFNLVSVPDTNGDLAFGADNSFSVAFWLQFTNGFNDLPIIGNSVSSTYQDGWVVTEDNNQLEWTAVGTDVGSVSADPAGGPLLNDGNWHHCAVVFDRGASNAVSYVDGQSIDTRSIASLGNLDTGNTLTIGQDPTDTYSVSGTFNLDDLGLWSRALSSYEVLSIYNAAQLSAESFDVYGPVSLSITSTAGQIALAWQAGTLEYADELSGAQTVWTPVTGAAPPVYTVAPTAAHLFYRIEL
jgi:hypothetical protein